MKRVEMQQRGERRIAAALRIALVAVLVALQVLLVVLISHYLWQHAAILYTALQVVGLCMAVHIYNRTGDGDYKLTWIILILFAPVAGLILYLLWGGAPQRRRLAAQLRVQRDEPESVRLRAVQAEDKLARALPNWARLCAYLRSRGFLPARGTHAAYLAEGRELLDDLLEKIEHAEHFIFLEYYILAEGQIWDRLFDALARKARAGVEVKLICDDFGNIKRFSGETMNAVRDAGIELLVFNPVHEYVNRLYFNYRDHRKLAVIDGNTAYTGGVNLADEYANLIERHGYWKDGGVRLEGEGVWGMTKLFLEMWEFLGGTLREERDYYRPHGAVADDGVCQCFGDGPMNNPDDPAYDTFLQLILNARRFLYITTPYFVPDAAMLHALCIAGDGGVDVRLMLPGKPDHLSTDIVAESWFGELLAHGVKIYRYAPGFLHNKTVMVDREVAFVGSVNMDYRSFKLHYECGVLLYGAAAIEDLLEDMDTVVAQSRRVTAEEWKKRAWYRRMWEPLLRLFAIWL